MALPIPQTPKGTEASKHELINQNQPRNWRLGGKPYSMNEGDGPAIDWAAVTLGVYIQMTNWSRPTTSAHLTPQIIPESSVLNDFIQQSIAHQLALWSKGVATPESAEDLIEILTRRANALHDASRKRNRFRLVISTRNSHQITHSLYAPSMRDMFETIVRRQRTRLFYAQLFDSLDFDARRLLNAVLRKDLDFEDSRALQYYLCMPTLSHVSNTKRRILYAAKPILERLSGPPSYGDTP